MSKLIKSNQPCHVCGSSDARAFYEDGEYCFSCTDRVGHVPTLKELFSKTESLSLTKKDMRTLPSDMVHAFPTEPLKWLRKFGITDFEIHRNNIGWSPSLEWIIFPIYDDEDSTKVVAWEVRNFSDAGPKSLFYGSKKDVIHIISYNKLETVNTIVIVEDIISSIKVGRVYPCLCLFGSEIDTMTLIKLKKMVEGWDLPPHLTLWLDPDKLDQSLKIGQQAFFVGFDVSIVYTIQDPKYHDADKIKTTIEQARQ